MLCLWCPGSRRFGPEKQTPFDKVTNCCPPNSAASVMHSFLFIVNPTDSQYQLTPNSVHTPTTPSFDTVCGKITDHVVLSFRKFRCVYAARPPGLVLRRRYAQTRGVQTAQRLKKD